MQFTLSKTHNGSAEPADGRTDARTHLDLLLQEVDFMLLLQKLLLLPSNLGSRAHNTTLYTTCNRRARARTCP